MVLWLGTAFDRVFPVFELTVWWQVFLSGYRGARWLIVLLKLGHNVHEALELPVVHIGSTLYTHTT